MVLPQNPLNPQAPTWVDAEDALKKSSEPKLKPIANPERLVWNRRGELMPADLATEQILTGEVELSESDQIPMVSPEGVPGTVPGNFARELLMQGYRLQTVADYQALYSHWEEQDRLRRKVEKFGHIGAALLGAVEGTGLGMVHGWLVRAIEGEEAAAELAEFKDAVARQYPKTYTAGLVAGVVLPGMKGFGVLSKTPTGLILKGSQALEARLLGQTPGLLRTVGTRAAGGFVEGMALEGMFNLSELALSKQPINAETLVAAVGPDALWGGVVGGIFGGALGGLEGALGNKARNLLAVDEALADKPNLRKVIEGELPIDEAKQVLKASIKLTKQQLAAARKVNYQEFARQLTNADTLVSKLAANAKLYADVIGDAGLVKRARKLLEYQDAVRARFGPGPERKIIGRTSERLGGKEVRHFAASKGKFDPKRAKAALLQAEELGEDAFDAYRAMERQAIDIADYIKELDPDFPGSGGARNLDELADHITAHEARFARPDRPRVDRDAVRADPEGVFRAPRLKIEELQKALESQRQELKILIEAAKESGAQFTKSDLALAAIEIGVLDPSDPGMEDLLLSHLALRFFTKGRVGIRQVADKPGVLHQHLRNMVVRGVDRAGFLMGRNLARNSNPLVSAMSSTVFSRGVRWVAEKALEGGQKAVKTAEGSPLRNVAVRGADRAGFLAGRNLARNSNPLVSAMSSTVFSRGARWVAEKVLGGGRDTVEAIESTQKQLADKLLKRARIVERARRVTVPSTIGVFEALTLPDAKGDTPYQRAADSVSRLISNPKATEEIVRENLRTIGEEDPALADQAAMRTMTVLDELSKSMPKQNVGPLGDVRDPAPSEIKTWSRVATVLLDPLSAFDRLAEGMLSFAEIQALSKAWPEIYSAAGQILYARAIEDGDLSRREKTQLSLFFGVPFSRSMEPVRIANFQANYASAEAGEELRAGALRAKPNQEPTKVQSLTGGIVGA